MRTLFFLNLFEFVSMQATMNLIVFSHIFWQKQLLIDKKLFSFFLPKQNLKCIHCYTTYILTLNLNSSIVNLFSNDKFLCKSFFGHYQISSKKYTLMLNTKLYNSFKLEKYLCVKLALPFFPNTEYAKKIHDVFHFSRIS